jgi:hypothetical protein
VYECKFQCIQFVVLHVYSVTYGLYLCYCKLNSDFF